MKLSILNKIKEEKCEHRVFTEAKLKFDSKEAILDYQGKNFKLVREDPELISQNLDAETTKFLFGLV